MQGERDPRTHAIIGAAMDVHSHLGRGFLESVYHEALAMEFTARSIPFVHEMELPVCYKGTQLKTTFRADFVCFSEVIVEIKAISQVSSNEEAQLMNYLRAAGLSIGLLLNFGMPSLFYKRYVHSQSRPSAKSKS